MTLPTAFIFKMVSIIVAGISPDLRTFLKDFILKLEEKAKATANPFDDLFVELLRILLDIRKTPA